MREAPAPLGGCGGGHRPHSDLNDENNIHNHCKMDSASNNGGSSAKTPQRMFAAPTHTNMETVISDEDLRAIKTLVTPSAGDEIAKKELFAIKGLYLAMKEYQKTKGTSLVDTLRDFGFKFDYEVERTSMIAIIKYGIFVFIQNNLGYDTSGYESSCPETLEEWYCEFSRFCDSTDKFSAEALHILASCCYVDMSITIIEGDNFANATAGQFSPDPAIDLFILDNMNRFFETEVANLAIGSIAIM
jgi:hypothetical protein